jgi:hypothetical protein
MARATAATAPGGRGAQAGVGEFGGFAQERPDPAERAGGNRIGAQVVIVEQRGGGGGRIDVRRQGDEPGKMMSSAGPANSLPMARTCAIRRSGS